MTDRIEKTIDVKAPIERVWRALTDHKEFGAWFRVKLDGPEGAPWLVFSNSLGTDLMLIARTVPRVLVMEFAPIAVLLTLCACMTVFAGPLMRYAGATAEYLHAPAVYISDVLGTPRAERGNTP